MERVVVFVFNVTIISLVLIFFHCGKCKKYYRRKAILFCKKNSKIYSLEKPLELIHFQPID